MSKIKDIPVSLRPREKAFRYGVETLSDAELLAILISSGGKDNSALDIANELIKKFCSLNNIINTSYNHISKIKGISKVRSLTFQTILEIIKRYNKLLNNPLFPIPHFDISSLADIIRNDFINVNEEYVVIVIVDKFGKIMQEKILFKGTRNKVIISASKLINTVLESGYKIFYIFHNHPSGNPLESNLDTKALEEIENLAKVFNLKFMDHIIITEKKYYSYRKQTLYYF